MRIRDWSSDVCSSDLATNRPDVLDPALLRPGRFDRQVVVSRPDIEGRIKILEVHMKKVPLAPDVDGSTIARGTPGFSGADLEHGRASCRDRVGQYVSVSGVAGSLKTKTKTKTN